jgi:hypothetical protein
VSEPPRDSERQFGAQQEATSLPAPPAAIEERQVADEAPRPKTIEETKEQVRGQITGWSIFTFILTIVLALIGVFTGHVGGERVFTLNMAHMISYVIS